MSGYTTDDETSGYVYKNCLLSTYFSFNFLSICRMLNDDGSCEKTDRFCSAGNKCTDDDTVMDYCVVSVKAYN